MKLWEALKTGKKYKRKDREFWYDPTILYPEGGFASDDWEVEPDLKRRMLAYIARANVNGNVTVQAGELRFEFQDVTVNETVWLRAPWLDEPEEK